MPEITIYTDGSALGNPGPGGYGAVLISGRFRKEVSQGYRLTTNNRMELLAVCVALEMLKFEGSDVTIYSDSKYVVDAVEKRWVFGWEKKGFAGKKNPDYGPASCTPTAVTTSVSSGSRVMPIRSKTTAATNWP